MSTGPGYRVLFLSKDLLFWSRVKSAAEDHGARALGLSNADDLIAAAAADPADAVLLDLTVEDLDVEHLVSRLRELSSPPKEIVAFGPHVDEVKLAAARDAQCDEVLSKGEFNKRMASFLTRRTAIGPSESAGARSEK